MAKYAIPSRYRSGFKTLIELDATSLNLLTQRLVEFPIGGGPSQLVDHLHDLPIPNIDEVSTTIYSFGNILVDKNRDLLKISTELIESLIKYEDNNIELDNTQGLINNLLLVFESAKNIKTSFKAQALANDVPNIFRHSTILTDLRMVYPDDLEDSDRHAIVSQTLRIVYLNNDEDETIHITLDRKDLETLKTQIDRALAKESIIRNDYGSSLNIIKLGE